MCAHKKKKKVQGEERTQDLPEPLGHSVTRDVSVVQNTHNLALVPLIFLAFLYPANSRVFGDGVSELLCASIFSASWVFIYKT